MPAAVAAFTSKVVLLDDGRGHHILPVPDAVAARFTGTGSRRVRLKLNGREFRRALQNHADGGSFILLGLATLREAGLSRGSTVTAELRPDAEPDAVELPEELVLVLAENAEARAFWTTLTPPLKTV